MEVDINYLLNDLKSMLFEQKQPFLIHLLRKKLGSELRKNLRKNLGENDIIIYTDFSKGKIKYQHNYYLY